MKFVDRIFIAIACAAVGTCTVCVVAGGVFAFEKIKAEYLKKYQNTAESVSQTISGLDVDSEGMMKGVLEGLSSIIRWHQRLPSNDELKRIRTSYGAMSIDIADQSGNFVRSSSFPEYSNHNLFSFCPSYKNLFNGIDSAFQTPLMPNAQFGRAMKFALKKILRKPYVLNVGFEFDFVGRTLKHAVRLDENLLALSLKAPNGTLIGQIRRLDTRASGGTLAWIGSLPIMRSFLPARSQVAIRGRSAQPICCECVRKGLVAPGMPYDYSIELEFGMAPLRQALGFIVVLALVLIGSALASSLWISRLLARILVSRLDIVIEEIERAIISSDVSKRIASSNKDEIGRVANAFNKLLSVLEINQKKLVENEREISSAAVAKQIAHDIRSPLSMLNAVAFRLKRSGIAEGALLELASKRINYLASDLLNHQRAHAAQEDVTLLHSDAVAKIVDNAILELKSSLDFDGCVSVEFLKSVASEGGLWLCDANQLNSVIVSILRNSLDAVYNRQGKITVSVVEEPNCLFISVEDNGCGLTESDLNSVGNLGWTKGKINGNGLGLYGAKNACERWGASLSIRSSKNIGTCVEIKWNRSIDERELVSG